MHDLLFFLVPSFPGHPPGAQKQKQKRQPEKNQVGTREVCPVGEGPDREDSRAEPAAVGGLPDLCQ